MEETTTTKGLSNTVPRLKTMALSWPLATKMIFNYGILFHKQKKKKVHLILSLGNHKHAPQRASWPTSILSPCMKPERPWSYKSEAWVSIQPLRHWRRQSCEPPACERYTLQAKCSGVAPSRPSAIRAEARSWRCVPLIVHVVRTLNHKTIFTASS